MPPWPPSCPAKPPTSGSTGPRKRFPNRTVRLAARPGTIAHEGRLLRLGEGYGRMRVGGSPAEVDEIVRIQCYARTIKEVNPRNLDPT